MRLKIISHTQRSGRSLIHIHLGELLLAEGDGAAGHEDAVGATVLDLGNLEGLKNYRLISGKE